MNKIFNDNIDRKEMYFGAFIVLTFIIFITYRGCKLQNDGVITICKVDHYEPAESGSSLFIKIYYHGKEYNSVANTMCGECNGKLFFVRIIKNQPLKEVIFLKDHPVPDCILINSLPFEGWNEIPICD